MSVANEGGSSPFLLIGDHAGAAIPQRLGDLGVGAEDLKRHIASDIGIHGLGIALSGRLDAPFVHQHYSRLVIDCNRDPSAADAMPGSSDGTLIPGNADLSQTEREARIAEIARPYQARITEEIASRLARRQPTVLVSLHSFTPVMDGFVRPWRFGVLHREDSPFSRAVLARLQSALGEAAGDNAPYRMDEVDYTVPFHADANGIDYMEIEVRQDLIGDEAGQAEVAGFLAKLLPAALADLA